jgi:hypothetical protein
LKVDFGEKKQKKFAKVKQPNRFTKKAPHNFGRAIFHGVSGDPVITVVSF